jgi:hypothetical protein
MHQKRVFKTKPFGRWAKKLLSDALLCRAALEIEQGAYDADLGQGVCKKRIALPGQGKSGSTRTLVAKQHEMAIFFLVGRSKSDPGADFTEREEETAKVVAGFLHAADTAKLAELTAGGELKEICNAQEGNPA